MKNEKYRARIHTLVLYPDDPSHVEALELIKSTYDYAYILHDKDLQEDGTLKKAHWHVIIRTKNAVWNNAICKQLSIGTNYIEQVRNFDNALQYLIHYNDKDKTTYPIDDVQGTLKTKLVESINKIEKSEGEKVVELIQFILNNDDKISVTEFATFCALNGYWSEFRRSGAIFCKMLDEHNESVSR